MMGLLSNIRGRLQRSGTQADTSFVSSYQTGATSEFKNIGVTSKGHLVAFNTTLQKPLKTGANKWFDAAEYFSSTTGLHTGFMVVIDQTPYRVMRVDLKRGKYWLSQPTATSRKSKVTSKKATK